MTNCNGKSLTNKEYDDCISPCFEPCYTDCSECEY